MSFLHDLIMRLIILSLFLFFSFVINAGLKNESELNVVVNGGNTSQEVWAAKSLLDYNKTKNKISLDGHYQYGRSDGTLSARNWHLGTRYERTLSKRWSLYFAVVREEDKLANLFYRWNIDGGGKYYILQSKKKYLFTEIGYRRTLEKNVDGKVHATKLRFYAEFSQAMGKSVKAKLWGEYLPNVSVGGDWQVSSEASLKVLLNQVLSLKVAYLHKYDNQVPSDTSKTDYQVTTALIAQFE